MDDADKTIAYTDQDGRIKLFKVTMTEFLSSSIWKNPLQPKDTQPLAQTVCCSQNCVFIWTSQLRCFGLSQLFFLLR